MDSYQLIIWTAPVMGFLCLVATYICFLTTARSNPGSVRMIEQSVLIRGRVVGWAKARARLGWILAVVAAAVIAWTGRSVSPVISVAGIGILVNTFLGLLAGNLAQRQVINAAPRAAQAAMKNHRDGIHSAARAGIVPAGLVVSFLLIEISVWLLLLQEFLPPAADRDFSLLFVKNYWFPSGLLQIMVIFSLGSLAAAFMLQTGASIFKRGRFEDDALFPVSSVVERTGAYTTALYGIAGFSVVASGMIGSTLFPEDSALKWMGFILPLTALIGAAVAIIYVAIRVNSLRRRTVGVNAFFTEGILVAALTTAAITAIAEPLFMVAASAVLVGILTEYGLSRIRELTVGRWVSYLAYLAVPIGAFVFLAGDGGVAGGVYGALLVGTGGAICVVLGSCVRHARMVGLIAGRIVEQAGEKEKARSAVAELVKNLGRGRFAFAAPWLAILSFPLFFYAHGTTVLPLQRVAFISQFPETLVNVRLGWLASPFVILTSIEILIAAVPALLFLLIFHRMVVYYGAHWRGVEVPAEVSDPRKDTFVSELSGRALRGAGGFIGLLIAGGAVIYFFEIDIGTTGTAIFLFVFALSALLLPVPPALVGGAIEDRKSSALAGMNVGATAALFSLIAYYISFFLG